MKQIELKKIQRLIDKVKQNTKYQFIYISRSMLNLIAANIKNFKSISFENGYLIVNDVRLKVVTAYFTTTDILLSE